MSHRAPRPLRLLQSSWSLGFERGKGCTAPTIAVYKPSGLPYFAASQVAACSGGRELFSASPGNMPAVEPTDVSDSLLSRMTDLLPPGSGTPRVVLPLIHPALSRYATASQVNALTAQRKGTSLVACSPHEFMFLRNCHRLHLVRSVYRVLCRLPSCVSIRVRQALCERNAAERTTRNAFKNPYVQQFLRRSGSTSGESGNIFLGTDGSGSLPRCAYPHPLLQGGFINVKERCLLPHGTVSGYLSAYQIPRDVHAIVKKQQRLKALFLPPIATSTLSLASTLPQAMDVVAGDSGAAGCDICRRKMTGQDEASPHPWIGPECQLRIALDVRVAPEKVVASEMEDAAQDMDHACFSHLDKKGGTLSPQQLRGKRGACRLVGKPFKFDFRLVTLNNACDLALYEVGTNNASDEEVKAAFAAANFTVVNDFVNDVTLAEAMQEVAGVLHTLPQIQLADLPMIAQHVLREGSPLELVAEPLLATSTASPVEVSTESQADGLKQLEQVSELTGVHGRRYRLLLEALRNLEDEKTFCRVAQLALGGGLECTALHFPDPRQDANLNAVQHLLLRMEEGEATEAYCKNVAERMSFVSRGTTVDCETYETLIHDDVVRCLPSQRDVTVAWGAGHPTVVRSEECGEVGCAYCGERGHVWSACPAGVPLLPSQTGSVVEDDKKGGTCVVGDTFLMSRDESDVAGKALDNMLLATVDDVEFALEDATRRQGNANVISIPNVAPTQTFNPHAWRRHHQRPALHQRRLRCAYCSGQHHITRCPRLSGAETGAHPGGTLDTEQLRMNAEKLFCIKCGEFGHLYDQCPAVPRGLHTATHCPICLQPHRNIQHEPLHCPRRVTPPQDYLASGVPAGLVRSDKGRRKPAHHGGDVLLADSFLSHI
ncbi:hypothetical protein TraAM80_06553 [Trypanosoma rangeli]|uniref:CCHC-type domain-containing protein n=1 Tax=Trypanosoma rangeli TaxID=5698 RepID=A0A422N9N2_TRYRA|nr:uncharacterized protein TraAM80_06553 [Trypanosoma rangeli]RNF02165.1 hypothetical protein TraAM80_06553 [Trypanosoma rangeli]|eukprot:RNF02165.1 hypothetical protein TraAM80_06553 [Trypanosoma rangeli]